MDINQLKAFEQVVRHGSFSKAARVLGLSQPTVSIRIQGLERSLGGSLFIKSGRSMVLSDLGHAFFPYARQSLEVLNKGVETAKAVQLGKKGDITLGTLPTFTDGKFAETISRLHKEYPEINLAIHTGHNQQIIEMLYDGFLIMGFVTYPFYNPDLKILSKLKEPLYFYAHNAHPIHGSQSIEEIINQSQPFILVDWNDEIKFLQRNFISHQTDYIEAPPLTALEFVKKGEGVALFTESMVADLMVAGVLKKLDHDHDVDLYREIALVALETKHSLTPSAKTFIKVFES